MLLSRVYQAVLLTVVTATPALAAPVVVSQIQGYGFDENRQLVEFNSLAFDDESGKVLARGSNLAASYPNAQKINGQGKTLLPGLIDGHGHVLGLGQNLSQVDLRQSSSEAQAVAQVAAARTQRDLAAADLQRLGAQPQRLRMPSVHGSAPNMPTCSRLCRRSTPCCSARHRKPLQCRASGQRRASRPPRTG